MRTVALGKGSLGRNKSGSISKNIDKRGESQDPEDYVHYVVKWKGMQASEVTWQYWKYIKQYYVDAAEDLWQRQRPPTAEKVKFISERPHQHVKNFKKLSFLLSFGVSKVKRRVADILKHFSEVMTEASSSSNNGDDDNEIPALHIHGYQLEVMNWLIQDWWNRRSCILAEDMGLG